MPSDTRFEFTKENIDTYLNELAKEYRRRIGKGMPAEITLIGGASVLINYGFRNMTTDIDALIRAASVMKDAINSVRDKYDLPVGWLNEDFKNTDSYTVKLDEFSQFHKTFSNVLTVRTVSAEYLIAMKLRSGRQYKNDLSDVLGILAAHEVSEKPIRLEDIQRAVSNLYKDWESLPVASRVFIENVMDRGNFEELYDQVARSEQETRSMLIQFEQDYPDRANASNIDMIASNLQKKTGRESILEELRKIKPEQNETITENKGK